MYLSKKNLKSKLWQDLGINFPQFDIPKVTNKTLLAPTWVHIAPSNIFRAMVAPLQQYLIECEESDTGIIAIETYDKEIIEKIYKPYDNLSIQVVMYPDGRNELSLVANIADAIFADTLEDINGWEKAINYFSKTSLQIVSVTCTEKGYDVKDLSSTLESPDHIMAKITALVYHRYRSCGAPLAIVSMDNCSENGLKLKNAVMKFAEKWYEEGSVDGKFIKYLEDEVSFPWTMIDRITPRPSPKVKDLLESLGLEHMDITTTQKGTVIAPFVNSEHVWYLVIQDDFPNGRPNLEKVGVIFCETPEEVSKYEKMKVGACLNPNQTTLSIFGCLLNYGYIYEAMRDPILKELIYRQSYEEFLPVVERPGMIEPKEFLSEVLEERLTNPNIPDTPARIITDTSQKLSVRYGDTIKAYGERASQLTYIPLTIAGWCRYLLGLDDNGKEMNLNPSADPPWNRWSPDPMLKELTGYLSAVEMGRPETANGKLLPILSNKKIFGIDLYDVGLGGKIESFFKEMISGSGAVKSTLRKFVMKRS